MKFPTIVAVLALTSVSAEVSLRTNSEVGQKLLSKARQLNNNNNNNNNYYSWIADYSIKFDGCASIPQFDRDEGIRTDLLAKFKLCPSDKCSSSCTNGGEYIIDMKDFVEAWQEAKEAANEQTCATAEYNCELKCQNGEFAYTANDDNANNYQQNCVYQCLVSQKLGFCAQDNQQQNEVNMNELAECRPLNNKNNNNNNNGDGDYQIYYVGAYCSGNGVYAGVFTDSSCSKKAPSGTYELYSNNGVSLPTEPLVEKTCISCLYNNNNNNNNNNGNYVSQNCAKMYEQSTKCESKVTATSYQDNSGCEMINDFVPKMSTALNGKSGNAAKVFAWLFAITIVAMGFYIYRLHKMLIRPSTVDTSELVGTTA